MRLTVHAVHPAGFPISIELDPSEYDKVDAVVERIVRQGYRAPLCMKHGGVLMAKRAKQGDEWYSHRIITPSGEERYCRGVPSGRPDDGFAY